MTARDLIAQSLRVINAVASGETPTAAEENDALVALNSLLSYMHTQGRTMYTVTRVTRAIIPSQASYTIGTSGNINRTRPTAIQRAAMLRTAPTPDVEIQVPVLSQAEWESISIKNLTSPLPTSVYYNPTHPLGTVHVYPIGTDASISIVLYLEEPLAPLATLTTVLVFPPGYERMLKYKLAIEIAPEYERPVSALVLEHARESWAAIQRTNVRPDVLRVDDALLTRSGYHANIYSGG